MDATTPATAPRRRRWLRWALIPLACVAAAIGGVAYLSTAEPREFFKIVGDPQPAAPRFRVKVHFERPGHAPRDETFEIAAGQAVYLGPHWRRARLLDQASAPKWFGAKHVRNWLGQALFDSRSEGLAYCFGVNVAGRNSDDADFMAIILDARPGGKDHQVIGFGPPNRNVATAAIPKLGWSRPPAELTAPRWRFAVEALPQP